MNPLVLRSIMGAANNKLASLGFVASATSSLTSAITVPSSANAGDVAVLFDVAHDAATPTYVLPSGWTLITTANGSATGGLGHWSGYQRTVLSMKILTNADIGASVTGMSGSLLQNKTMAVFRGSIPATTISAGSAASTVTQGDPAAQIVTASSGTAPLIVVAGYFEQSGDTGTFSTTADGTITQSYTRLRYKSYNASPADTTVDVGDSGDVTSLSSAYIQVS